jgi:proteasome accessory factor B
MSVNKLERLLNLTAVLLNTSRPLTAEEIRQKVEGYPPAGAAFHRAFERDKDDLRVLGIPLSVEKVGATDPPIDGYRIRPDDYYLPDAGLDPDELAALHLASLTVRLDGLGDQEALWKLGGLDADGSNGGAGLRRRAEEAGVMQGVVASLPSDPALVPIFQSITDGEQIEFVYRAEPRTVDPWRLDFHRGRWYLTGFDHSRQGRRNFRLDRIDGVIQRTGTAVGTTRPDEVPEAPRQAWEFGSEEPTVARLLVDESHGATAARQLGSDVKAEDQPDGSVIFEVPVVRYEAFRTFVLGFLEHAEILEPVRWRDDIVAWLSAIASQQHPTRPEVGT